MHFETDRIRFTHTDAVANITLNTALFDPEERERIANNLLAQGGKRGFGIHHPTEGFLHTTPDELVQAGELVGFARTEFITSLVGQLSDGHELLIWDAGTSYRYPGKMPPQVAKSFVSLHEKHPDHVILVVYDSEKPDGTRRVSTYWPFLTAMAETPQARTARQQMLDEITGKRQWEFGPIEEIVVEEQDPKLLDRDDDSDAISSSPGVLRTRLLALRRDERQRIAESLDPSLSEPENPSHPE